MLSQTDLTFKPHLNGMRGIAVIAVIIYHANFSVFGFKLLPGGYTGVDIFFVLSGYLISRILLTELDETGKIAFIRFYIKRVRRLVPMLLVVIASFIPIAYLFLLPNELLQFSESSLTAIFFLSNFYFSNISTIYGAESSLLKPVLHTWSLSVEEQFYLITPVLLLIIHRLFEVRIALAILTLVVISLLCAEFGSRTNLQENFFFPLSRFWEMWCGTLIALIELRSKFKSKIHFKKLLSTLGLVLILWSLIFFDRNAVHPGFSTLIPVVGTVLSIYYSDKDTFTYKILTYKYLQQAGELSYSLYLWHFPLFAFSALLFPDNFFSLKIFIIVFTITLALVSYKLIETPLRYTASKQIFLLTVSVLMLVICVPLTVLTSQKDFQNYWISIAPRTLSSNFHLISDTFASTELTHAECKVRFIGSSEEYIRSVFDHCRQKHQSAVIIIGDSHGSNLHNAAHLSNKFPFLIDLTQGGCRPTACQAEINQYTSTILDIVAFLNSDDIVIYHQSGGHFVKDEDGKTGQNSAFQNLIYNIDNDGIIATREYLALLSSKIKSTLVWLGPFPEYQFDPKKIIRMAIFGDVTEKLRNVNPNSIIILSALERALRSVKPQGYRYISFDKFYKVKSSANIEMSNGRSCFQFKDEDHFSFCGEQVFASRADWGMFKNSK